MHFNINSLVYKVDELRYIARLSNPAVIGISESKLDKSITDLDTLIDNHDLLRRYRNGNKGGGGGGACYIRNDLSYTQNFPMTLRIFSSKLFCQKSKQ